MRSEDKDMKSVVLSAHGRKHHAETSVINLGITFPTLLTKETTKSSVDCVPTFPLSWTSLSFTQLILSQLYEFQTKLELALCCILKIYLYSVHLRFSS